MLSFTCASPAPFLRCRRRRPPIARYVDAPSGCASVVRPRLWVCRSLLFLHRRRRHPRLPIHLYVWCPEWPLTPHDSLVLTNRRRATAATAASVLSNLSFVRPTGPPAGRQAAYLPVVRLGRQGLLRAVVAAVALHRALVKVFLAPEVRTSTRANSVSYVTVFHP